MLRLLLCLFSSLVVVGCTTTPVNVNEETTPERCTASPLTNTAPQKGWYRNPFVPDACFYLYRQAEDFFAITKTKLFNDAHVHEVFVDKIVTSRNSQPQAWLLYYPKRNRYHGIVLVDTKSSAFTTYRDLTKKFPLLLQHHQLPGPWLPRPVDSLYPESPHPQKHLIDRLCWRYCTDWVLRVQRIRS